MATPSIVRPGSPERDAAKLLATVWADASGTITIPVDSIRIARDLGIHVFLADLDASLAGLLVKEAGRDPEIYLNARDSAQRQRFTGAHEIGHYIKRAGVDSDAWEYIDRRDALSSTGMNTEEVYANKFAAALLMPEDALRRRAGSEPVQLAYEFGVSTEAMNYRLKKLGLA